MIYGADVSFHQSSWKPKSSDDFVIIKATEGSTYVDPKLHDHHETATEAGLVVGYYHFLWPDGAEDEARWFVDHLPDTGPTLLACDWEGTPGGTASEGDKDKFMAEVARLRPDCRVGLYTFCSRWLDSNRKRGDFLWIADPDSSVCVDDWLIWQYSWEPIDQNRAKFDNQNDMQDWIDKAQGGGGSGLFGMTEQIYARRTIDYPVGVGLA